MNKVMKMDLIKQHRTIYSGCKDCQLGEICKPSERVWYRGSIPCDVLFVGEAPGEAELCTLEPFTNRAGDYLEGIIKEVFPSNVKICFVNAILCAPRDSRISKLRPPKKAEIEACSKRLIDFISISLPEVVVAVGKSAETSLSKLDITYVPIKHPSSILRQEEAGAIDIKRVYDTLTNIGKDFQ